MLGLDNAKLNSIKEKEVFLFSSDKIKSQDPHNFICIKCTDKTFFFACCTSQFETVKSIIEKRKLSEKTLVYIPGKDKYPQSLFKKDTFINCNQPFPHTHEEILKAIKSGLFKFVGVLPDEYYLQILIGLHESDMVDDCVKEILPKPEDF